MKQIRYFTTFLAVVIISLTAAPKLTAENHHPMLIVTAKDFGEMMESSKHVLRALEQENDIENRFLAEAGNPEGKGIDFHRPWHLAYWFTGIGQKTYAARYIPVTDFDAFVDACKEGKEFRGRDNANIIRKNGEYAVIITRNKRDPEIAPDVIESILQLSKQLPKSIDSVYRANLHIDAALRQQLLGGLQMLRGVTQMQLQSQQGQLKNLGTPIDAIGDIVGLYFEFGTLIVNGLEDLTLNIRVDSEQITLNSRFVAMADSELAGMLRASNPNLARFAPYLDGDASMVFAAHLEGSEFEKGLFSKLMTFSAKIQGGDNVEEMAKKLSEIMDKSLPVSFVGSFDMGRQFRLAGLYEFPDDRATDIHKDVIDLLDTMTKEQIGANSLYSSYESQIGARKVNGIPVDLITSHINTNSPLMKLPGQLDTFRLMWPDDKITFEYASKDNRIFYSMGVPIEKAMNKAKDPAKLRVTIDKNTVLVGRYNFLKLIKTFLPMNRMMPKMISQAFTSLDHTGTGIDVKANLDGGLDGQMVIPLKLLTQFSRAVGAMSNNRKNSNGPAEEY